jgi:ferredoxin
MAYMITRSCIQCGACQAVCPNNAIIEEESIYIINPDLCTECIPVHEARQCAEVCPVQACVSDPANQESVEQMQAKYYRIHS